MSWCVMMFGVAVKHLEFRCLWHDTGCVPRQWCIQQAKVGKSWDSIWFNQWIQWIRWKWLQKMRRATQMTFSKPGGTMVTMSWEVLELEAEGRDVLKPKISRISTPKVSGGASRSISCSTSWSNSSSCGKFGSKWGCHWDFSRSILWNIDKYCLNGELYGYILWYTCNL